MKVSSLGLHREQFVMDTAVAIFSRQLCSVTNPFFGYLRSVVVVWLLNLVFVANFVNHRSDVSLVKCIITHP